METEPGAPLYAQLKIQAALWKLGTRNCKGDERKR